MNVQKDMHRGENPRGGKLQKNQPRTSYEDLCADGTVKSGNRNPLSMYVGQRVSSPTVGETNSPWSADGSFGNNWDEILNIRLRC